MKTSYLLRFAALSAAIVIPSDDVMSQVAIESNHASKSIFEKIPSKERLFEDLESTWTNAIDQSKNAIDDTIDFVSTSVESVSDKLEEEYFDTKAWLAGGTTGLEDGSPDGLRHGKKPPHKGKRPHGPHHGHHGDHPKPNMTVYELISKSKYTTRLAKLINEYDDLVDILNGTTANFTIFAPTGKN